MSIEFSSTLTKRIYKWNDWKIELSNRKGVYQYDNDSDIYYIVWFYDNFEIFISYIWKNSVPEDISLSNNYSQEQNDLDKSDFEENFIQNANKSINKLANNGVIGQAPGKGLGGFAPDPKNNPYEPNSDEIVNLYVDGEGSLVTRGAAITDEGSMREDFSGNSLYIELSGELTFTENSDIVDGYLTLFNEELNRDYYIRPQGHEQWYKIVRVPSNNSCNIDPVFNGNTITGNAEKTRWIIDGYAEYISLNNSNLILSSSAENNSIIHIYRDGDYLPILLTFALSVSQRINNQDIFFGLRDETHFPKMYCDIILDGYDDTYLKFRSAWNNDEEISHIKLPSGLKTSMQLRYKIDVSAEYCALSVNGVLIAKHENHIPDPYLDLNICAGIINYSSVTNTNLNIDTIFFSNQDTLQISNTFLSPIPTISKEDQHTILGSLFTNSTSTNQIIVSYTVPDGKVFYLIGYKIECVGSIGGFIKIGKNNLNINHNNIEIDGDCFRLFAINPGSNTGEIDFSNPRKIGVGGDIIKVTVTPKGSLNCEWRAFIDFVLR